MVFSGTMNRSRNRPVFPAILSLFIATILAFLSVNIAGQTISLTALPLVIIALWPRDVYPVLSVALFLICGIFLDWGSAGAPGQWALVFLAVFAVLRPDRQGRSMSLGLAIRNWVFAVVIAAVVFTLAGRFVYGVWPNATVMLRQFGAMTLLLPFLYFLRQLVYRFFSEPEDRYI